MTTHRHTEDSEPSADLYRCPHKILAKNIENVMLYHLGGVSAPRTSMDFIYLRTHESSKVFVIHRDVHTIHVYATLCVCVGLKHSAGHILKVQQQKRKYTDIRYFQCYVYRLLAYELQ